MENIRSKCFLGDLLRNLPGSQRLCCPEQRGCLERYDVSDGVALGGTSKGGLAEESVVQHPVLGVVGIGSDVFDDPDLEEREEFELDLGTTYKGQWKGIAKQGYGTLTKPDGQRYEGCFVQDLAHGFGKYTTANGCVYEGQWAYQQAHGHGAYTDGDGTTYEGEWHEDEKTGRGIESWLSGARYEGEFLAGAKHGVGTYRSSSGARYEGQFKLDKMDGAGVYDFERGRNCQTFGLSLWSVPGRARLRRPVAPWEHTRQWPDAVARWFHV